MANIDITIDDVLKLVRDVLIEHTQKMEKEHAERQQANRQRTVQHTEGTAQRTVQHTEGYKTIMQLLGMSDADVKDFKKKALRKDSNVTTKELTFVRNRIVEMYFQDGQSNENRGILNEIHKMITRLSVNDGSNPFNTNHGVDDVTYPFIYTITELLAMPKSEFEQTKNTIILTLTALEAIRNN